jgi:Domain of unknown function (DUF4389)
MNEEGSGVPPTDEDPQPAPGEAPTGEGEQVRIVIRDDLERSRLTVGFRLILAIPHLIVLYFWGLIAVVMAVINWFAIMFSGRTVEGGLQARFLRYFTHVDAYLYLAANPFPPFAGQGDYPIDLVAVEQRRQSRWKTFFRLILAVPALILGGVAFGTSGVYGGSGHVRTSIGILGTAAFLGWFAALARARMPRGLRDLSAYALWYSAQAAAYLLLLTDRYPNSDPLVPVYGAPPPDHPIRISCGDDLRRSRLTVFFRLLLWLPHLGWLILWGIATFFAIVANWFVTLFAGRPAHSLHRFISAYLRYLTHNFAFIYLVGNPFPGFTGRVGSYPVDLSVEAPARQNRWRTGFRIILAVPTLMISGAIGNALAVVALFGWFTGLFLGRMPQGLRNLGVFALRYQAQVNAYLWLLTDAYPFSGPSLESRHEPAPLPETA